MVILPPPEFFTESDKTLYLSTIPKNRMELRQLRAYDALHVYCLDGMARVFREYHNRRDAELPAIREGYVECRDASRKKVRVSGIARPYGTVWFFEPNDSTTGGLIKVTQDSFYRVNTFRALSSYLNDEAGYLAYKAKQAEGI